MKFQVQDKKLSLVDKSMKLIGGNEYEFQFEFDGEWQGEVKTVRFIINGHKLDILLENDKCVVDRNYLNGGSLLVGVYSAKIATEAFLLRIKSSILDEEWKMPMAGGDSTSGTFDYGELDNKPSINGVELNGDKSLSDLGIENYDDSEIINRIEKVEEYKGYLCNTVKTVMDSVAIAGVQYYLGEQTAVDIILPDDAEVGQMVTVAWYNGETASTLSINGTTLAFGYTPCANTRSEINALWDGTYWAIIGNEMTVPAEEVASDV